MKKMLSLLLAAVMLFTLTTVFAEETQEAVSLEDALYQVNGFLYDDIGAVIGVEGAYVVVGVDEDGIECLMDTGVEETYVLADDCVLEMPASMMDDDLMVNEPVEDLGVWYDEVILQGLELEDNETFYGFTTTIELNDDGEIIHMEYVFTPWG